jgi:predicted transcriptional regulator
VGFGLAEEVASSRPPKPGPEWWLLLDLAMDADDVTRQTACGYEYMASRTQAPRSTVFRWLKRLADAGLIKVVQHSKSGGCGGGKGERAVYEIQVPPRLAARIGATLNQVSPRVGPDSALRSHKKGPDSEPIQVSPIVRPDYPAEPDIPTNQVSPAVRPPIQDPIGRAPLEGAELRTDQDRSEKEDNPFVGPEREARRAPAA